MSDKKYRATVRLSTADDETLALPGDLVTKVPDKSLAWLKKQGLIVDADTMPPRRRRAEGDE